MKDAIRILEDGKVLIDYGPVTMTVSAYKKTVPATKLCQEAFQIVETILKELKRDLPILRQYAPAINDKELGRAGKKMLLAVRLTNNPKMTPMAAIAGTVADLTADWIYRQGATKVVVNNGGDIALRLDKEEEATVGILPDLLNPRISKVFRIKKSDRIGGIATSGLHGRSLTCGIANSVSVFAENSSIADAMATQIANSSYINSPNITVKKAAQVDPDSDIADQEVVVCVGKMTKEEIQRSLCNVKDTAKFLKEKGCISFAAADVGGEIVYYPALNDNSLVKQFYELP